MNTMAAISADQSVYVDEPVFARKLFSDTRLAPLWLAIRLYAGYEWISAGYGKLTNPAWTGANGGTALAGFAAGALKKAAGDHPDVTNWYAWFLQNVVLPHTGLWGWMIALGETAVGIGLVLGLFTGIAAFFGGLMNANYLLSGTVSSNPVLFIIATWLVLAWRTAGWIGLDRWLLPALGVPGHAGWLLRREPTRSVKSRLASSVV